MYRGGLFDHIGFGFCRYSTDKKFLVPHFEKMLYDNALLIIVYCKAFAVTNKALYLEIAEKTDKNVLALAFPPNAIVILLDTPTKEYPLKNGKVTYYVCKGNSCLPPSNELNELI